MKLKSALLEIEKELGIRPPLGSTPMSVESRFRRVAQELQRLICSRKEDIRGLLEKTEADLTAVLTDVLLVHLSGLPVPVATVARHISKIGLERFCSQPELLTPNQGITATESLADQPPSNVDTEDSYTFNDFASELGSPIPAGSRLDPVISSARFAGVAATTTGLVEDPDRSVIRKQLDRKPAESFETQFAADERLESGMILWAECNAVAAKRGNKYFSGMSTSMPMLLRDVVLSLCTHPEFFPQIGEYNKVKPQKWLLEDTVPGFLRQERTLFAISNIHTAEAFTAYINRPSEQELDCFQILQSFDDLRRQFFDIFLQLCLKAIWDHEIAHIRSGHVDHLQAVHRNLFLFELPSEKSGSGEIGGIRQYMEFEADLRASRTVLMSAAAMMGRGFEDRFGFSDEDHFTLSAFSSILVSFILHYLRKMSGIGKSPDYPTDGVRSQAVRFGWYSVLGQLMSEPVGKHPQELAKALDEFSENIGKALISLASMHPYYAYWLYQSDDSEADTDRFIDVTFAELKDEIEALRRHSKLRSGGVF